MARNKSAAEPADVYFPDFRKSEESVSPMLNSERVS